MNDAVQDTRQKALLVNLDSMPYGRDPRNPRR